MALWYRKESSAILRETIWTLLLLVALSHFISIFPKLGKVKKEKFLSWLRSSGVNEDSTNAVPQSSLSPAVSQHLRCSGPALMCSHSFISTCLVFEGRHSFLWSMDWFTSYLSSITVFSSSQSKRPYNPDWNNDFCFKNMLQQSCPLHRCNQLFALF